MNKHEQELLELVREKKERLTPDIFRSWLRGFRLVGRESEELATELDKFKEEK